MFVTTKIFHENGNKDIKNEKSGTKICNEKCNKTVILVKFFIIYKLYLKTYGYTKINYFDLFQYFVDIFYIFEIFKIIFVTNTSSIS